MRSHHVRQFGCIRQGAVETLSNRELTRGGPGSMIFDGSNQPNGLKNVGTEPAVDHAVNVKTAATPPGGIVVG